MGAVRPRAADVHIHGTRGGRTSALLLAALIAHPSVATAQWYVAGYLGQAWTASSTVMLEEQSGRTFEFKPVSWDARSFDTPLYYGVRVGRESGARLRVGWETEFTHLKVYANGDAATSAVPGAPTDTDRTAVPMTAIVQRFAMSHGMNLLLGNLVVSRALGESGARWSRIRVAGRLGGGITIPHAESTVRDVRLEGYEVGGAALQVAGGLEWRLTQHAGLLTEYKFTRARPNVEVNGGRAETTIRSQHLVAGARWEF
jgi:opacity protein-like surface antigen